MKPRHEKVTYVVLTAVAIGFILWFAWTVSNALNPRRIAQQKLEFLDTQQKPLLLGDVERRLGDTEDGEGPYYEYKIVGSKKSIEFWMAPPPDPFPQHTRSLPVEVALVVEASDGKARILWPKELSEMDFNSAWKTMYPKSRQER